MIDNYNIGICGLGFVGSAVYLSLKDDIYWRIYDKYKNIGQISNLLDCDVIFVCVPTPTENGKQNATELESTLKYLEKNGYPGIVIIKSTVLKKHVLEYNLHIVYNPEFLNQNTANKDFERQSFIILGGEVHNTRNIETLYNSCFKTAEYEPYFEHTTIETAIQFKYIHNLYHAYKALFWNYVNETTGNSRKLASMYEKYIARNDMSNICADGLPGVGGACFPKDMIAFGAEYPHELTDFLVRYNTKIRRQSMLPLLTSDKD